MEVYKSKVCSILHANKQNMENVLENIKDKAGYIIDMDGVIYHGNKLLPGVTEMGSTGSLIGRVTF